MGFEWRNEKIGFAFLTDHSGCCVENEFQWVRRAQKERDLLGSEDFSDS